MSSREALGEHDHRGRTRHLLARISRMEIGVAAAAAVVLGVLVVIEPDIVRAPFASGRAVAFTFGGTALAAVAFVAMLVRRVPPVARMALLGVPFVAVNAWLLSPYFVDASVDDDFSVSIADAAATAPTTPEAPAASTSPSTTATVPAVSGQAAPAPPSTVPTTTAPAGPVLLGAGQFVGLAGHDGTGDAGIFRLPDGGHVLRFENFDIDNGPALRLYLVPGADRRDLGSDAIDLGKLRGNVGDQTYDVPDGLDLRGPWTALVWCEAFSVEFVGATVVLP